MRRDYLDVRKRSKVPPEVYGVETNTFKGKETTIRNHCHVTYTILTETSRCTNTGSDSFSS